MWVAHQTSYHWEESDLVFHGPEDRRVAALVPWKDGAKADGQLQHVVLALCDRPAALPVVQGRAEEEEGLQGCI